MSLKPDIGVSPITGTIFAGRLNKAKTTWVGEKHDITDIAVNCVAEYLHKQGVFHEFYIKGKTYKLSFTEIENLTTEQGE